MNPFKRVSSSLFNKLKKYTIPSHNTINKTGIVKSDHPKPGNGWIKGWVVNVQPKNIIIVCSHAVPTTVPPNNKVFVYDEYGNKIERTIIKVNRDPYKLDGVTESTRSDIAICLVDKPFPDNIKGYNFSTNLYINNSPTIVIQKDGNPSDSNVITPKKRAWIKGVKRQPDELLEFGDSGTPWFVWEKGEWRVVTHTYLGWHGEGPWYSHPYIFKDIKSRIELLQK